MPQNKLVYSKDLDYTYILGPDGKTQIGGMSGDHRNNPLATNVGGSIPADSVKMDMPYTRNTNRDNMAQMGKDFVVNAASQAPLMLIPGAGPAAIALRLGGSLAAGYGTDRLLNPQDSRGDSASNAALNTIVGEAIPWLMENRVRLKLPGIRTETNSATDHAPTISESRSTNNRNSTRANISNSQGSSTGTSEGLTSSRGVTNSEGTSLGKGSYENSGETAGEGGTSGSSLRDTTIRKGEFVRPKTEEMIALQNKIANLKTRAESGGKWTAGQLKAFDNLISGAQNELSALQEANTASGSIIHSEGATEGTSKRTGTSAARGSNQNESKNIHSGTSNNESANKSTSNSNSRSDSTSEGTSNTSGVTNTSGTVTPGTSTTNSVSNTTGHTFFERALGMLQDAHITHVNNFSKLVKFLAGLGGNTAIDATVNKKD